MGRSVRADYKIVAKSYARIGNAYNAMGNLDEAIRAYEVRQRAPCWRRAATRPRTSRPEHHTDRRRLSRPTSQNR